ncbi:MAG: chemotaxis protein CheA, partial [Pseudomonadota bacterium]|nr:chemotaxis protein CheA [Pseudomonadota bacterium]
TLADDGSPILLFDPAGLAQVGGIKLEMQERTARVAEGPAAVAVQATAVLLFRGLDGGRRALRLAVVDRIEEVPASAIKMGAGQIRVQLGEAILPLAGVNGDLPDEKIRVFRLNDGQQEIGYAFREVVDLATIDNDVILADAPGEISGVSLICGEPAELVDAHWLFAKHLGVSARRSADRPVCRLPGDDPWMQHMLRPIVEAAGYRVVGDEEEGEADLVIATDGKPAAAAAAARTIVLRADPDAAGDGDDTIYRYDRAGLLIALKAAGAGSGQRPKLAGSGQTKKLAGRGK